MLTMITDHINDENKTTEWFNLQNKVLIYLIVCEIVLLKITKYFNVVNFF